MNVGLCIPTYNAGSSLDQLLPALATIRHLFCRILVIDSTSTDGTNERFRNEGYEVLSIEGIEFDHGGTRQKAVEMLDECEVVVFLTQDAIPLSEKSITRLIDTFDDPEVAIAYGRQLPRVGAGPIEAHARIFNYPVESRLKSQNSIPLLGLRAAVVSNSFAAYRRATLLNLGGFPSGTLFGEDTLTGAKAILAGYTIAYVGDATVYHSHNYSLIQEFRRYFDNGVFYSREKWILNSFGKAEGSGKAYVVSEMKYLYKEAKWLIPVSVASVFVKFLGYKIGGMERYIPARLKFHLSMNKSYWCKEILELKS